MAKRELAGWDKSNKVWQLSINGKRIRRSPRQLGLSSSQWTRDKSRSAANAFFEQLLIEAHQLPAFPPEAQIKIDSLERKIRWLAENSQPTEQLRKQLKSVKDNPNVPDQWESEDHSEQIEIARLFGVEIPKDVDPEFADQLLGDRKLWQERLVTSEDVEDDYRVDTILKRLLTLEKSKGNAEQTYREVDSRLNKICTDFLTMDTDIRTLDEATVDEAYIWCKANYEKARKQFGFFKRLCNFAIERKVISPIANLNSRQFKFDDHATEIPEFTPARVRKQLDSLPDHLRLYSLLGLNCSMLPNDIANLAWSKENQIVWYNQKKKSITRKRVKLRRIKNAPTITYPLWNETIELLEQFQSNHPDWVLTSKNNTKLVRPATSLICQQWRRYTKNHEVMIRSRMWRSVGATYVRSNKTYLRYTEDFLCNSPDDVTVKNYAPANQGVINDMVGWLGKRLKIR